MTDEGRDPSGSGGASPYEEKKRITRSVRSIGDRTFLVLSYGRDVIASPIMCSRLSSMQCAAITESMAAVDAQVQANLQDAGLRLEYEGHVEVVETDDGNATSVSLHDAPFEDRTVARGAALGIVVDDGIDLGRIVAHMLGHELWREGSLGCRVKMTIEVLEKEELR